MQFKPCAIKEVIEILPSRHGDHRGYFMETYRADLFERYGIATQFKQDNESLSTQHTLRGMHYQIRHPQGKLVRVTEGTVFDVAVDLRKSSKTFGQWVGVTLSAEKGNQLWVPPGFAHGFYVLSATARFQYKCTDYYHPEHERCLYWNDPDIAIDWPFQSQLRQLPPAACQHEQGNAARQFQEPQLVASQPLLSAKDKAGLAFEAVEVYQ